MPAGTIIRLPDRSDPPVRRVLHRWRTLTGGGRDRNAHRRTLIACSGGADSSALALILRSASDDLVVSHVVHDLRDRSEALADRDTAAALADALGLEFIEGEVSVAGGKHNAEALARKARYGMLAEHAERCHCPFIATAHHADDQLETVLMRLLRGAGPRGLAGVLASRPLGDSTLIRPMLAISRADAERICERAGWRWREDATNRDLSRLRARLRERVLPELRTIEPRAGERAVEAGGLLQEAGELIRTRASELLPDAQGGRIEFDRDAMRPQPDVIVGEIIRLAVANLSGVASDRLPRRVIARVIRALREQRGESKRFTLRGAEIRLDADTLSIAATERDRKDNDVG